MLAPLASARDGSLEYFVMKATRRDRLRLLRAARATPSRWSRLAARSTRQTSKGNRTPDGNRRLPGKGWGSPRTHHQSDRGLDAAGAPPQRRAPGQPHRTIMAAPSRESTGRLVTDSTFTLPYAYPSSADYSIESQFDDVPGPYRRQRGTSGKSILAILPEKTTRLI